MRTVIPTALACAICLEPLPAEELALFGGPADVHARCHEAGEAVLGLVTAILAEQRGAAFCGRCLAADLDVTELASGSAVWHLGRRLLVSRGRCPCGAPGWRLAADA
jgi:hypothetical protein